MTSPEKPALSCCVVLFPTVFPLSNVTLLRVIKIRGILSDILAFYLTSILTYILAFYCETLYDVLSGILRVSGIYSDILSGILSGIRVQACPTASGAGDMVSGKKTGVAAGEGRKELHLC